MSLKFRKVQLSTDRYESAAIYDVDNDGHPDIVSGATWYQGPDFVKRHPIYWPKPYGDYYDDFSTIPLDVNGDGNMDHVSGGYFGGTLRWHENPGGSGKEWREHVIDECGPIETTQGWDIDGDGVLELCPNLPNGPLVAYSLDRDERHRGTGRFRKQVLHSRPQGHGLGFGAVTGRGLGEFVVSKGWYERPANPDAGEWIFHDEFDLGSASVPVIVSDLTGNGLGDLIVGQAHGYGLDWWEQRLDARGRRSWLKHPIDPGNSQYHTLLWVDIDGDGQPELVTGKRYFAHCGRDPGESDDLGIYYFKWTGEGFSKQIIDYGPLGRGAGCGIYFAAADLRGTGRLDIVAPGKDGLKIYFNEGF